MSTSVANRTELRKLKKNGLYQSFVQSNALSSKKICVYRCCPAFGAISCSFETFEVCCKLKTKEYFEKSNMRFSPLVRLLNYPSNFQKRSNTQGVSLKWKNRLSSRTKRKPRYFFIFCSFPSFCAVSKLQSRSKH